MGGLQFLFSTALWALPLAGLPVLLHLLFRKKSPIIHFSTVRFIKASVQRTAARKRLHRWLLLACRALLLALLVWAVAQPARQLAAGWAGNSRSMTAAVVLDTSYSMMVQDQQSTVLSRAGNVVEDLLRGPLKDARVALLKSAPPAGEPDQVRTAAAILSEWTPPTPQPAPQPLADRIVAAMNLLRSQQGDDRWLIVVSDFQLREFPQALPEFKEGKVLLLDLRPEAPRSNGITRLAIEPRQLIPGLPREAVVDVAGRAGDARVEVSLATPDGRVLKHPALKVTPMDESGRSRVRVPVVFPPERWLVLKAALQGDDALSWDNERSMLVEVPPRQVVSLLEAPQLPESRRVVRLALDSSEGELPAWPLVVRPGQTIAPGSSVVALVSSEWPELVMADTLASFVRGGGTLIWFLRPGLEASWSALPEPRRGALSTLLPSAPLHEDNLSGAGIVSPAVPDEPVLEGLTDPAYEMGNITVLRYVPFAVVDSPARTLLQVAPKKPGVRSRPRGLVFRRPLGAGTVFTFGTLPESQYSNLATHQLLLPILVNMALRPPSLGAAQNVELGEPLTLAGSQYDAITELQIQSPTGEISRVAPRNGSTGRQFIFAQANAPGLYTWRNPGATGILAMANVQLPAAEAELIYRAPDTLADAGPDVIIARSVAELEQRLRTVSEPEPKWSLPIAIVLLLLCAEAFLGSTSKIWKPRLPRAFAPSLAGPANSL